MLNWVDYNIFSYEFLGFLKNMKSFKFEIIQFCRHPASFKICIFIKFRILEIFNFHPWICKHGHLLDAFAHLG